MAGCWTGQTNFARAKAAALSKGAAATGFGVPAFFFAARFRSAFVPDFVTPAIAGTPDTAAAATPTVAPALSKFRREIFFSSICPSIIR